MAWSGHRIYVLCEKPKKVRVFHGTEPFEEEEGFEIAGMGDQLDMAVSRTGNRLIIISDWDRDFLWKIKVPDKIPIREKIDGHPGKLWISPTDKLLLVVNKGTSRDFNLDIYSVCDDSWERSVSVSKKVTSIWHAVETSKKTFIISHANRTSPRQWLVSELSADGRNFIHTFDPTKSNGAEHLRDWHPFNLAIDADDTIYVAEPFEKTVYRLQLTGSRIVLNDSFQFEHKIRRFNYVREKKQLIVGQYTPSPPVLYVAVFHLGESDIEQSPPC